MIPLKIVLFATAAASVSHISVEMSFLKDGLPYLFHSFRNKYFNKISLGNMLYFQNKL